MEQILTLIQYDFDNMENRDANCQKQVGVFVSDKDKGLTAHGVAAEWFSNMKPVKLYLGWDGNIYPRFELKTTFVLLARKDRDLPRNKKGPCNGRME